MFFRDEQRKLQEKLKAVESKLIVGGVNLVSGFLVLTFDHFVNIYNRVKWFLNLLSKLLSLRKYQSNIFLLSFHFLLVSFQFSSSRIRGIMS